MQTKARHNPPDIRDHLLRFQRTPKLSPSQVAEGFERGNVYEILRPDWYWRWVRRDRIKVSSNLAERIMVKREHQAQSLVAALDTREAERAERREANRERRQVWRERRKARAE